MNGALNTVAIAVFSTCNIFFTAYRRELVAVFKVSCFPFFNCFASLLLDIIFLPALPSRTVYPLFKTNKQPLTTLSDELVSILLLLFLAYIGHSKDKCLGVRELV